jgi:ribosomal-protein-alanine N-acetyltransferase
MRSSLSDPASPSTLNFQGVTVSLILAERARRNQLAILQRQEPQALVGCCGLRGAGCEVGKAELGIELAPAYWARHGYAIEVGRALLEFGFGDLGLQEIYGVTVDANTRIARVAEWFGAEAVATRSGAAWMSARGWNETQWRITRDQWRRKAE